jgi:hypothetical protein
VLREIEWSARLSADNWRSDRSDSTIGRVSSAINCCIAWRTHHVAYPKTGRHGRGHSAPGRAASLRPPPASTPPEVIVSRAPVDPGDAGDQRQERLNQLLTRTTITSLRRRHEPSLSAGRQSRTIAELPQIAGRTRRTTRPPAIKLAAAARWRWRGVGKPRSSGSRRSRCGANRRPGSKLVST